MKMKFITSLLLMLGYSSSSFAIHHVSDKVINGQRETLAEFRSFGPQAPRDIDNINGHNNRLFGAAPEFKMMNLCNPFSQKC